MTMKRYQELKKLWAGVPPAGDILYPNCPAKRLELKRPLRKTDLMVK
jgi:hypothetical protein